MGLQRGQPIVLEDEAGRRWRGHVHRVTEVDDPNTGQDYLRYVATVQFLTPVDKENRHSCSCSSSSR